LTAFHTTQERSRPVSGKREYFKYSPETIGDFALIARPTGDKARSSMSASGHRAASNRKFAFDQSFEGPERDIHFSRFVSSPPVFHQRNNFSGELAPGFSPLKLGAPRASKTILEDCAVQFTATPSSIIQLDGVVRLREWPILKM
jgi:hypothetical protein